MRGMKSASSELAPLAPVGIFRSRRLVGLKPMASSDGADGSVKINQDAKLFVTLLAPGEEVAQSLEAKRHAWLQIAKGEVELNGQKLHQGDGAAISNENRLTIKATEDAEVLLFDLA